MKGRFPGAALAVFAAVAAYCLRAWFPAIGVGVVVWAILLGFAINALWARGPRFESGLQLCEKKVLECAVVLLGAQLQLKVLAALAPAHMAVMLAAMCAIIAVAPQIARGLGMSKSYGLLVGIGSAICGSAAIAAVSPAIARDRNETALSIAAINLVGFAGMLILPWLANVARFDPTSTALLLGGALPAVGHAVGAGYALGDSVGALTVTVKMSRVMCLLPLIVVLNVVFAGRRAVKKDAPAWRKIPWFVPGFAAMALLRTSGILPDAPAEFLVSAGHAALAVAMAAIGLRIDLRAVLRHGPRAMRVASIIAALFAAMIFAATWALS